ncbi:MAG: hypothetical protein OQL19_00015 [Gammaproteobacteria bacterium]|nr:hypothetical protein [Gammaproteobacteria bacterium]
MARINNISSILEIARLQLGKRAKTKVDSKKTPSSSSQANSSRVSSQSVLKSTIVNKLKQLDSSDKEFISKARVLFLESIILWEFGDSISSNAPYFSEIISKIDETIENDPESAKKFKQLIEQLTSKI